MSMTYIVYDTVIKKYSDKFIQCTFLTFKLLICVSHFIHIVERTWNENASEENGRLKWNYLVTEK